MEYDAVIGLEVHAQLNTRSKAFCGCSTAYGAEPNTQVCPVCLGMPGVLPVLNRRMVEQAILLALALNATIHHRSKFDRKNYFYPDLPKGYQISQYDEPLSENGYIDIEVNRETRRIGIRRIHLEEDAGKLLHQGEAGSLVDMNRCGIPLVEVVSEPDLRHPKEAAAYLTAIRQLVRYLGICDGNMEQGSLRCDANLSIHPRGSEEWGTATEIKNMNSIRGVERALTAEMERQITMKERGESVVRQTMLWDEVRQEVRPMRRKETSEDYRYFPEPDLVMLEVDDDWIETIRKTMPELPWDKRERFLRAYGLRPYDIGILTVEQDIADYFEALAKEVDDVRLSANWVMGELLRWIKETRSRVADFPVTPHQLASLLKKIVSGELSQNLAKEVLEIMVHTGKDANSIVKEKGLEKISDEASLEKTVIEVLGSLEEEVLRYRNGEERLFGFFVGQVMKATKGKADPKALQPILRKHLKSS
jgi:aspartyl-tRNA(Asn)/glutamyl-tRNA(Gln) amidotransferase subunit B